MSNIPRWAALLLLLVLAHHLDPSLATPPSSSSSGNAWQRALFGRDSRNLMHRRAPFAVAGDLALNDYLGPYSGVEPEQHQPLPPPQQMRQQTEVYGIVEPLIEDTPCADRACFINEDCCPSGVCSSTYGEGKCVYMFGQRDVCQRHADCPPGSACMLVAQEGVWRCESDPESGGSTSLLRDIFGLRQRQPLGSECSSSSDCQVINGMCCQQQRLHHRAAIKLSCGYFRDAFDCVDMVGSENHRN
ncbi:ITG-like peptide [Drosophila elegans]|uniref:ITG-like peptide n=1 Tax=Drosophila elegans TaxID=30023 RepID=UPI001BC85ECE|nr:ITG-like peptide [Drosophila elegans]